METTIDIKVTCAIRLKEIATQVTADDRKMAEKEFGVHYVTIARYLGGKIGKIDIGIKLYEFFNERIEQRKAALA